MLIALKFRSILDHLKSKKLEDKNKERGQMIARKFAGVVLGLVVASLSGATGCKSAYETRTPIRNPENIAADYWRARVAFWKSADAFEANHSRVISEAKRVANLQMEMERTIPIATRRILLVKGLVPVLLDFLAERASLSVSRTPDHPAVRGSGRIVDHLSEEYLVLRGGLSDSEIQELDRAANAAIAVQIAGLKAEAGRANEFYTTDHPRIRQISAMLSVLQDAGKSLLIAER